MTLSDTPARPTSSSPLSILVADDEPMIVKALEALFSNRGHEVHTATNADAALALLASRRFDAALVDARMPGGGLNVIARLEGDPDFAGRVVLMTGALATDPMIQVGPDVIRVQKPFRFNELLLVVEGDAPN